jgi:hypothetical protein
VPENLALSEPAAYHQKHGAPLSKGYRIQVARLSAHDALQRRNILFQTYDMSQVHSFDFLDAD